MHKIQEKEFVMDDFSYEHLLGDEVDGWNHPGQSTYGLMWDIVDKLNECRELYLKTKDKKYWWQMIQLLPSSYNQTRNVLMNYEVLANIYKSRKNHKLDEWCEFCKWIEELPYCELITTVSKKDLVEVTRCKKCKHYISKEDMKNNEMYKDYRDLLGYDGLCMNTDKWTDEDEFCSYGKKKED